MTHSSYVKKGCYKAYNDPSYVKKGSYKTYMEGMNLVESFIA